MEQKRLMLSKQVAIESADEDGVIIFHTGTCYRMKLTKPLYELLCRFKDPIILKDAIPGRADERLIECLSKLLEKGFLVEENGIAAREKKLAAPANTLFRCPRRRPGSKAADISVIGFPFDLGNIIAPGARKAPSEIRAASCEYEYRVDFLTGRPVGWLDIERRERILEGVTISDWGDIRFKYGESVETIFNRAADVILDVVSRGSFPLLIGGDHSVTFPAIKCLQSQHELAVIWLDAHTDFAEITPGAHINHANVARRIADLPNVLKLIHIGYRGYALDEDGEFAGEKVIRITPSDARQKGMDYVLQAVPEGIPCYISIDIDALDPIYAPGTSTPVPGGFSPDQMKSMLRLLGSRRRIAGLDLVEVNPDRDIGAITSRIACQLLLVALGAIKRAGRFFQK